MVLCFFLCFSMVSTFTAWIIKFTSHTKKLQTLPLTFPLCQKLILRNSSIQSVSKLLDCLHSGHLFDWSDKLKTPREVWEWIQTSPRLFFLHFFLFSFFPLPSSCPHFFRLNETHKICGCWCSLLIASALHLQALHWKELTCFCSIINLDTCLYSLLFTLSSL